MNRHDFFNNVAVSDDPLLFSTIEHKKMDTLKRRLGDLTGLRILEPGCGTGPLTEYLAEWAGPAGRVLSFDSSPEMVRVGRERLLDRVERSNLDFQQADIETIPLQPGGWDRIILFRVFPHLTDKGRALERIRSALAPVGELIVANLEGSARLNRFHARLTGDVRHDHMPCGFETSRLLESHGFKVLEKHDSENEFFVRAITAARK